MMNRNKKLERDKKAKRRSPKRLINRKEEIFIPNGVHLGHLLNLINLECEDRYKYLVNLYDEHVKILEKLPNNLDVKIIEPIGSLAHKTYIYDSDLDINVHVPVGNILGGPSFWNSYGGLVIRKGQLDKKYKDISVQLIMKQSTLLVTCHHNDGIKIDITMNNNKCVRNAAFYGMFGDLDVFRDTARFLKLYLKNWSRKEFEEVVHPGGFFYEMMIVQRIVDDNRNINIESAFVDIDINKIRWKLKKNGYTTERCIRSCVRHLLSFVKNDKLVFDYEECEYNYWSFKNDRIRNMFCERLTPLVNMLKARKYDTDFFIRRKNTLKRKAIYRNSKVFQRKKKLTIINRK